MGISAPNRLDSGLQSIQEPDYRATVERTVIKG
jgi:hypothetical protein